MSDTPRDNYVHVSNEAEKSYALTGKIMLTAIIVLLVVVLFLVLLHLYARWYIARMRRRNANRRRRANHRSRPTQVVYYIDTNANNSSVPARGLDASVLRTLPIFEYSSKTLNNMECPVCLSEFEENESGRILPQCKHVFHTECIDLWFQSHSTCPLCRLAVEPVFGDANAVENLMVNIAGNTEPGSSLEICATCRNDAVALSIVVESPKTQHELESRLSSTPSQRFLSPGSTLLSLKRMLSFNTRATVVSSSVGEGTSCGQGNASESEVESQNRESAQQETRSP